MAITPNDHTILVSGATGQQGGVVAGHLLEHGFHVRALTRDLHQASARALADRGAEIVEGNFDDRASLERALDGVYGAYGVQGFFEEGVEAEARRGKAFADAARAAGVEHFVYSSVGGAERETGIPHFESKWEVEKHVRALGLPATILRPVAFMENWVTFSRGAINLEESTFSLPLSAATTLHQIAVDDIGVFAALAFSNPDTWIDRAVEIAGDEPSMTEMAEILSRVTGREVEYVQVPWDAFEAQAGEEMTMMYRWFEDEGYETDLGALRELHPALKRLEPFLREQSWARAEAKQP